MGAGYKRWGDRLRREEAGVGGGGAGRYMAVRRRRKEAGGPLEKLRGANAE